MNFRRILLLVSLLPSLSFAQSAMPVGGGAVAAGAVAVPGAGSGLNMSGVYVPGSVPGVTATNTASALGGVGYPAGYYGYGANPLSIFAAMCANTLGSLLGGGSSTSAFGDQLDKAAYDGLDGKYDYAPNSNHEAWKNMAGTFDKRFNGKCEQKFIDREGRLGQWGTYMYDQMKSRPEIYMNKNFAPRDIGKYCPKFHEFSEDGRARFFTYLFMTMADPESSCNPSALGQGPNGTAIGLYQLEAPACARAGVHVSSQDLRDARTNMRCAVAILANELQARKTITVGTSRGFGGTYWAPLRDDIAARKVSGNSMARADTKASEKTQHLLKQFKECHEGEKAENHRGTSTARYTPANGPVQLTEAELNEFFALAMNSL